MASTEDVVGQIQRAFADPPRPADDELLHPDARDDNDIKSLYGVAHWRDLSDEALEYSTRRASSWAQRDSGTSSLHICRLPFVIRTAAPRWSVRRCTR
jgi:hypothetical protein